MIGYRYRAMMEEIMPTTYDKLEGKYHTLRATNAELLAILRRILAAHQSGNNGSVMGEAVLCRQLELAASEAIRRAEGKQ